MNVNKNIRDDTLIYYFRCVEYLLTKNAWQGLAYSPLGAVVSPYSDYL